MKLDSSTLGVLRARSIGPAAMDGRITAIDGVGESPATVRVGAAGGGVWRSTDDGTSFKPVFDQYTQSIGAIDRICLAPERIEGQCEVVVDDWMVHEAGRNEASRRGAQRPSRSSCLHAHWLPASQP